ncbi:MAG TPA: hypothetical protein VHM30_06050 [Gemmatimonadaceae bacterium]|nr:hypothetical protein [Gemmatimonadaceae bacterium]
MGVWSKGDMGDGKRELLPDTGNPAREKRIEFDTTENKQIGRGAQSA